jgi:hypothetical protein
MRSSGITSCACTWAEAGGRGGRSPVTLAGGVLPRRMSLRQCGGWRAASGATATGPAPGHPNRQPRVTELVDREGDEPEAERRVSSNEQPAHQATTRPAVGVGRSQGQSRSPQSGRAVIGLTPGQPQALLFARERDRRTTHPGRRPCPPTSNAIGWPNLPRQVPPANKARATT